MSGPRVTIVIPVFNGANYLRAAIDSALAQDYPELEVLVVNDGSTDAGATEAIALSYGERIRTITKPNGGVASALNAGIAAMSGEIFCWLSHDDRHLPQKTSHQVAEWLRLGRPDAVLFSDYREIDAQSLVLGEMRYDHAMLEAKPLYAVLRGSIHGCAAFVPHRLFDSFGTFDEALPTTQDYDLWHRLIRAGVPFLHLPEVLIESRTHAAQGSRAPGHREEARALWRRMVTATPLDERVRLEGSSYRYLIAASRYLAACGLHEAASDIATEAEVALASTTVSLIVVGEPRADRTASLAAAATRQTHPCIEVVVVEAADAEAGPLPPGVRRVQAEGRDPLAAGCAAAQGDWLALVPSGALPLPGRVARQLRAAEEAGARACHTAHWRREPSGSLARVTAAATLETALVARGALLGIGDVAALCHDLSSRGETTLLDEALVVLRDPA